MVDRAIQFQSAALVHFSDGEALSSRVQLQRILGGIDEG